MAELADALASGASGGNLMGVQLPPSAPNFLRKFDPEQAMKSDK